MSAPLTIAYTPDSDDAFNYCAWEHGHVALERGGPPPRFHRDHIIALNREATAGRFDVVAVSSVFYPRVAGAYRILAAGNSVGRGWGPVLASRRYASIEQLAGRRVAVGGAPTTGSTLALMYCPDIVLVEMPYDAIADAVAADEIDAGVMIHEELLHFEEKGLRRVADLGKAWADDTGLPLPVGLNLVRRSLDDGTQRDIARTCQRSLLWAFEHPREAYAFASQFGRGHAQKHVEMFSNDDTLCLPDDLRRALRLMFDRVADMGIAPPIDSIEIVDGLDRSELAAP